MKQIPRAPIQPSGAVLPTSGSGEGSPIWDTIQVYVRVRPVLEGQEHKRIGSRTAVPGEEKEASPMRSGSSLRSRSNLAAMRSPSFSAYALSSNNALGGVNAPAAPFIKWKWNAQSISHYDLDYTSAAASGGVSQMRFPCHRVYAPADTNANVFEGAVLPVVEAMLRYGIDGCVFTYGQTNSGKTYTTFGTRDHAGIVPRTAERIFEHIQTEMPLGSHAVVRVSLFEVYNEVARDLLCDGTPTLVPRDHPNTTVTLTGASEHFVTSVEELHTLLQLGQQRRMSGTNNVHEYASRSHCVVRLIVEKTLPGGNTKGINSPYGEEAAGKSTKGNGALVTAASIHLVDLAGSEANYLAVPSNGAEVAVQDKKDLLDMGQRACGAMELMRKESQARMMEGSNIRRSLLALQRCIALRAQEGNRPGRVHIPFRDSKLTRILRNALCGCCATILICTVDPTEEKETLSTLRFSSLAQQVEVTHTGSKEVIHSVLTEYQAEMECLQSEYEATAKQHHDSVQGLVREATVTLQELQHRSQHIGRDEQRLQAQYNQLLRRNIILAGTGSTHHPRGGEEGEPDATTTPRRRNSFPFSHFEGSTAVDVDGKRYDPDLTVHAQRAGVPLLVAHPIAQWDRPEQPNMQGIALRAVKDGIQAWRNRIETHQEEQRRRAELLNSLEALGVVDPLSATLPSDRRASESRAARSPSITYPPVEEECDQLEEEYTALQTLFLRIGRASEGLHTGILMNRKQQGSGSCSKPSAVREGMHEPSIDAFKTKHAALFTPLS